MQRLFSLIGLQKNLLLRQFAIRRKFGSKKSHVDKTTQKVYLLKRVLWIESIRKPSSEPRMNRKKFRTEPKKVFFTIFEKTIISDHRGHH